VIDPVVWTTEPKTAAGRANRWVQLRTSRYIAEPPNPEAEHRWVFTDGSSSGWHTAVTVSPFRWVIGTSAFTTPDSTRNVGAELRGVLLGVSCQPNGSVVSLVSDYLGSAAWLTGNWGANDATVVDLTITILKTVQVKRLSVRFIHTRGHQRDGSHFCVFNDWADRLCFGTCAKLKGLPPTGFKAGWDVVAERQQFFYKAEMKRQARAANKARKVQSAP
jgi:hypothetical protein